MEFEFDYHPELLLITPLIEVAHGECKDPACDADHWLITVGWLVWSVSFFFEL